MERTGWTDAVESAAGQGMPVVEYLKPDMTFLSENPEAFGLIPDACPLATKHLLIAANGYGAEGGINSPIYEPERPGVEGLFALYGELLPRTSETEDALLCAFGENHAAREFPVSRYCSVLSEVLALRTLTGASGEASFDEICTTLGRTVRNGLLVLRERLGRGEQGELVDARFLSQSVGICRIREEGDGCYTLDVFSAGRFRVYLLDEQGMAPLWAEETAVLSLAGECGFAGRSMRIRHPSPFAVILVSESVCALSAAEHRALRNTPGLIWRYRMRLEEYFLRIITDCVREHEFSLRATRFFVGHSHGWDTATGAMTILRDGVSYENFRQHCRDRLSLLERQAELLAAGYEPRKEMTPETRVEAELQYLRRLLEKDPDLADRTAEALRRSVLHKFESGKETDPGGAPEGVPEYKRLQMEELLHAFRRFDCENDEDRARIRENDRILRESLSEHWVTLRPCLLADAEAETSIARRYRACSGRIYGICLGMNQRLSEALAERQRTVDRLQRLLADGLAIAETEGEDWICGRADGACMTTWLSSLHRELTCALDEAEKSWQEGTERYRSLLSAYTAERDRLFKRDIHPEYGAFAGDWRAILEGSLPDERWEAWHRCLAEIPGTAALAELLEDVRLVSEGTGVLIARIRSRAAENRMAREMAGRQELRIAALRGAAYEDEDWGRDVIAVMDTATRNDFRATVRRWEEARRLRERQKEAYEAYSAMYTAYDRPSKERTVHPHPISERRFKPIRGE